jgi:L-ascorbate oxidase
MNDLSWDEVSYSAEPGATPYLIAAYKDGRTPDYEAALSNFGWDPKTQGFPAKVGEVIEIIWQQTNVDARRSYDYHPMHAHGEHYWDIGSGSGNYDQVANEERFREYTPATRDTTMLYSYNGAPGETTSGWRGWRLRVTEDNVGAWLMHCHLLQHMIMGKSSCWGLLLFIIRPIANQDVSRRHADGLGIRECDDNSGRDTVSVYCWVLGVRWQCVW